MTLCAKSGFILALLALCFQPTVTAQIVSPQPKKPLPLQDLNPSVTREDDAAEVRPTEAPKLTRKDALRFHKAEFIALSAGVYAAAVCDIHLTIENRKLSWWYETDPLARPIVRLPAPEYYATGLAMATGINWLSWKMGHSPRWRKLSVIPQVLSIIGNTNGFRSNLH